MAESNSCKTPLWRNLTRSFWNASGGNYTLIFALSFSALGMAGGLALDYGNAARVRSQIKNALDASVVGAVSQKTDKKEQMALAAKLFEANIAGFSTKGITSTFHVQDDGVLVGEAKAVAETSLMVLAGIKDIPLNTSSGAYRGPQTGRPLCIMAMHPTRKHTLEMKGSVSVYGPDCHIYGNSNHPDDVVDPHTPHNFMTGASVTAVGYGHHYIENVTPPLEGSVNVVADPYLGMTLPAVGTCTYSNKNIDGEKVTLSPGTYCGGLSIENGADVTLSPGLYTILGSEFSVDSSKVTGTGVTLYLADRHAEMDFSDSVIRLVAPTTGTWTSFVLLAKREETEHSFSNSTIDLYGIVYMPNGAIEWTNTGTPEITAAWTAWIADGFSWDGDGVINFPYKTKDAAVPHPSTLNVIPRPSIKEVVRLVF